jgi:hypothetical protein
MMSANVFVNRDKDSMMKVDGVDPEPEGMIEELKNQQGTSKAASPAKLIAKASANKAAKQRKRKREKKPYRRNKKPLDMPKRPLSAYNFFFREHRELILDERDAEEEAAEATGLPPSSHTGRSLFESMGKEIASRWKALSDQGHEKYTKLAEEDAGRYRREMVGYSSTQAASIRSAIVSESLQEKEKKQPPKLKKSPLIGNSGPGLTEPPNLKVDAWLQSVRGGSPPQPPQQPSIEDAAAFSPKSRLAAYHALQHQQLTNHQPPLGAGSHSQALMDVGGLQFHHPSLFGGSGGGSSGGGLHQTGGLSSTVGSIQAQVNLQNQILAEELASHQTRLVQGRLLEAQLSRMHQQQQGSSSFQSSSSSFQYPPAPAPATGLNQFMQQHQNRDYGDYAPPAGLYGLGSNVNLDQDGAFAAALRGAHQATSGGSSLLPSSFQSGSLESDYSRYLRSAGISTAVNQNPYSSGAGGSGPNFPGRGNMNMPDGGYTMP